MKGEDNFFFEIRCEVNRLARMDPTASNCLSYYCYFFRSVFDLRDRGKRVYCSPIICQAHK